LISNIYLTSVFDNKLVIFTSETDCPSLQVCRAVSDKLLWRAEELFGQVCVLLHNKEISFIFFKEEKHFLPSSTLLFWSENHLLSKQFCSLQNTM